MMNPYVMLRGALGGLLLLIGTYFYGRNDGAQIEIAKQAAVERAVEKQRLKNEAGVDDGNVAGQAAEGVRSSDTKEIYREVQRIVDRPVYRNVCVDADGVRSLQRAAAISNGESPGQPDGDTPADPGPAIPRGRDAGRGDGAVDAAGPV